MNPDNLLAVALATLCVAALIIGFLWRHLPFLSSRDEERGSDASPEPPRRPLRTEGLTPSVEQQRHCSAVKTDTHVAAEAMLLAYRRGGRHEVIAQLENLSHIFTTQQSSGHEGQVAITEFCNVLVHTDALDIVHALQGDKDPRVVQMATELFQRVVPRI